jgi:UDP-N-acetylmuramoyl-tripeptide--D-alanyl-D-alanine ligase
MSDEIRAPLWTPQEAAAATGGELRGVDDAAIGGVSIDSRSVAAGDLFFAIKGDRLDGHDYVEAALGAGAAMAVIERRTASRYPADARLLLVDDTLQAMRDLGRAARARSAAKIVAVTGSAGKTGTKEALKQALRPSGTTHASAASFNNHWGVPLSLARMPRDAAYAVFEIGMNHAGEISPLVKMVRPHLAIVTTIEAVHLEYFSGIEAIADAKAEIFDGLEPGGAAILNRDNGQFGRLRRIAEEKNVARIVSFGERADANARLLKLMLLDDSSTLSADILGEEVFLKLGVPGKHIAMNALAVLAAVKLAGADLAEAGLALGRLEAPPGRGRRVPLELPGGEGLLIDESYNANPASMRAAFEVLGRSRTESGGRKIAVLGDMLELGSEGASAHAALAEAARGAGVQLIYCAGPLMRSLWDALPAGLRGGYAEDSKTLEPEVIASLRGGDVIMVKASNGSRMGPVAQSIAKKFGVAPRGEPST